MVAAGGVAEFLDEVGQHRLKDSGIHRGRGVIIHENWELHRIAPSANCSRLSSMTVESRRSEEHTSELQSQSNLVCRLLLEKKKKIVYALIVVMMCDGGCSS